MVHTKQGTRTKLSLSQGREHTILHEDDGGEENPLADIVSYMSQYQYTSKGVKR